MCTVARARIVVSTYARGRTYICFFFQAEDGIRDLVRSRGLGDVYKRQVEDNGFNQEVLRAILERAGLVVDVAGEGRQALALSLIHI